MTTFTLINLETMRDIIENDIEISSWDAPDYSDVELLHFYVKRAVLLQQVEKAIALELEED